MRVLGIIPARYGSTRFPGKPLVDIDGIPMILRVVHQAEQCEGLSGVVVATDDQRIFDVVKGAGKNVVMTSSDHPSGTDRCLEAYTSCGVQADAIINIQGDEPFVRVEQLNQLVEAIAGDHDIATLAIQIKDASWLSDPNKVKVIFDVNGTAAYFSRTAIPFVKGAALADWLGHHDYFKHLGLYAYKISVLQEITKLEQGTWEKAEQLEQLRWLQNGYKIFVGLTHWETPAIDTPEDLEKALKHLKGSF